MTAAANIPLLAHELDSRRQFALWSNDYDDSPNPMLSLEERFLAPLLPEISGKDILDVGCGTGRWLARVAWPVCNNQFRRITFPFWEFRPMARGV